MTKAKQEVAGSLENLLGPSDIADLVGVPLATVYAWRYRGGGPPACRIGKYVRYRPADVRKWLEERVQP